MNGSSFETQSALNCGHLESSSGEEHILHSELAKFCLPAAVRDPNSKYAWANSICLLFLVIGLIGLKSPQLITRQIVPVTDIVPVVFQPQPDEQPPQSEPQQQEEADPNQEIPVDTPVIATVVAADPAAVNFAVPVEGPVVFAPAKFALPPPPKAPPPPKPVGPPQPSVYRPSGTELGTHPWPKTYPVLAAQRREEGTVMLYVVVDEQGNPETVEIRDSSGSNILDKYSQQWVKTHWRWQSAEKRYYLVPFTYQLQ